MHNSNSHTFQLPYGKRTLEICIPEHLPVDLIAPLQTAPHTDPLSAVCNAVDAPVSGPRLTDYTQARSVAIAINDKTRPVPHHQLLPPLLATLKTMGIRPDITHFFIATGTHSPQPPEEFTTVLPADILADYPVSSHNCDDKSNLTYLGVSARGTPIWINSLFLQADLRIVVGNIEPHQFAGFSGGVKTAVVGLGGRATINHNHAMLSDPQAKLGVYTHNPTRQDIEEIGDRVGVHFAINAVLNADKHIVAVLTGNPRNVMQAGIPLARSICQVPVPMQYAVVIASPGGHPKDINIYQSQKGMAHAALITKPGGVLIITAACPEGSGSQGYESWMKDLHSYDAVFERYSSQGFQIGPHKAFQIARDASPLRLHWYSDLDPDFATRMLLNPVRNLQSALDQVFSQLDPGTRIALMPRASATIPDFEARPWG